MLFSIGLNALLLGLLGEYIGRIFAEVKRRPLYIVGDQVGFEDDPLLVPAVRPLGVDRRRA